MPCQLVNNRILVLISLLLSASTAAGLDSIQWMVSHKLLLTCPTEEQCVQELSVSVFIPFYDLIHQNHSSSSALVHHLFYAHKLLIRNKSLLRRELHAFLEGKLLLFNSLPQEESPPYNPLPYDRLSPHQRTGLEEKGILL